METIRKNDGLFVSFCEIRNIARLKKAWERIVDPEEGKIYLTWSYHRSCCFLFRLQQILIHMKNRNSDKQCVRFFIAKSIKKEIVFVFPAVINHTKKTIYWLGAQYSSGSGYNNCICKEEKNNTSALWRLFLQYMRENYTGYKFSLHDIEEKSIIEGKIKERPCVRITLNDTTGESKDAFDEWYHSLSKSVRQNIRTAYNRINTDGKQYSFFESAKLPFKEKIVYYSLYHKRAAQINEEEYLNSHNLVSMLRLYIEMFFNICFFLINRAKRASIAVLKIDDNVAALMVLLKEHNGVIVPKLAINTDFSRYSPGYVLIAEFFRKTSSPFVFDLSRGAEPYKTALGGSVYYNYGFEIQL